MTVIIYCLTLIVLAVFSYGFIDPHLSSALPYVAYYHRPLAATIFLIVLMSLFACFLYFLKHSPKIWIIGLSALIMVFSYPALTYDVFNYMTTAKVLYTHGENPYLVMPIEISNEPNLAFTRAANKYALYGPVWLLLSAVPHVLGAGNVWATLYAFKLVNALVYFGFCYFVWKITKNMTNVMFFALNPLVLIEVLMNGHNDIYMMALALIGIKFRNIFLLAASWLIKGATLPLILVMNKPLVWSYWILAGIFFVLAPIREELYPWYAVWLVTTASLLPLKKHSFIFFFTIVLTFALELRNLPYIWMGYYEGPGPILRFLLTVIPITVFLIWYKIKKKKLLFF